MLRKSVSQIFSTSLQCSRGFASKKPPQAPKDWWNEPINEAKPIMEEESSSSKKVSQIAAAYGQPTQVVTTADSTTKSLSNYKETPCAEKKFSPCAERKRASEKSSESEKAEKTPKSEFKDLMPPSEVLQHLKSYEVKSTSTSFKINASN